MPFLCWISQLGATIRQTGETGRHFCSWALIALSSLARHPVFATVLGDDAGTLATPTGIQKLCGQEGPPVTPAAQPPHFSCEKPSSWLGKTRGEGGWKGRRKEGKPEVQSDQ